jgi:hypothetical protein
MITIILLQDMLDLLLSNIEYCERHQRKVYSINYQRLKQEKMGLAVIISQILCFWCTCLYGRTQVESSQCDPCVNKTSRTSICTGCCKSRSYKLFFSLKYYIYKFIIIPQERNRLYLCWGSII